MTSEARREPFTDSLLTPENTAMVWIDYEPSVVTWTNLDLSVLPRYSTGLRVTPERRSRFEQRGSAQ